MLSQDQKPLVFSAIYFASGTMCAQEFPFRINCIINLAFSASVAQEVDSAAEST